MVYSRPPSYRLFTYSAVDASMYCILLVSVLAADPVPRGDYVWGWLPMGLGGQFQCIATDPHRPNVLYASANRGLMRSLDTSDGNGVFVGEPASAVKPETRKENR